MPRKKVSPNVWKISEISQALPRACSDELAAVEFLEAQRWPSGASCPHCGGADVYQMKDRKTGKRSERFLWRCKSQQPTPQNKDAICGRQFTVRVGTVYEDSKIALRHWCFAFWAACASKKGVSALQIKRHTGISYESALFLMHRIRWAMADEPGERTKLDGTIEADETFVGGKPRNRHIKNKRSYWPKAPVLVMLQRDGDAVAFPIQRVTSYNLQRAILANVSKDARLITDQHPGYPAVGPKMAGGHDSVNHGRREYARGDVNTNSAESFFSIFKRGLMGTYHSVSRHHLHRYVSEFAFRHNVRKIEDGERVSILVRKAQGKRLFYAESKKRAS